MPLVAGISAIAQDRFGSFGSYGFGVGPFARNGFLYLACSNPAPNQSAWTGTPDGTPPPTLALARVLQSQGGSGWTELDTDNGPQVSTLKAPNVDGNPSVLSPIGACLQDADTLLVAYFKWNYLAASANTLSFSAFNLITGAWGAETTGGPAKNAPQKAAGASASADLNVGISMAHRSTDGAKIFLWADVEVVGGLPFQRVFYAVYHAGWGAAIAVNVAQTGSTDNYNLLGAVSLSGGRTVFVWQVADSIFARVLDSTNTLQAIVTIATGAVADGSPPGQSLAFALSGTQIAIGYRKGLDSFVSIATSANVPVFVETQIFSNPHLLISLMPAAGGLFAFLFNLNTGNFEGSTSVDGGSTWSTPSVLTFPDGVPLNPPVSPFGLFGYVGSGIQPGFSSSGVVVNGWKPATE